ncbi:hypothetical protein C2S53_015377 [Perilla frutescens var. hirtella]|uniref:Uncharacterized protein n=1 Tax=Perilla frutescens var. hirtella TaxID=608512 RepID=A0AAD4J5H2_PERFH|nr:hypothetical protein C2S53_015377 [Perilla frutescens var. hirtella]
MKNTSTNEKKMQHMNLFQYGVVAYITLAAAVISRSDGRELRPSEHGLAYQRDASPPTNQNGGAQEMLSFFGSSTPSVPLPEAQSIGGGGGDTWWSGASRERRRDHLRLGLLAAAAICGLAGVVLMVVAGVVFHLRCRREKSGGERLS